MCHLIPSTDWCCCRGYAANFTSQRVREPVQPVGDNYVPWEQSHGGDQIIWLGIKRSSCNHVSQGLQLYNCSGWIYAALDGRHGRRATLRKTYLVHIATSLRHAELYGKKANDLPSGSAVGSVHAWVHVDILESHSGMVQLSETVCHRE